MVTQESAFVHDLRHASLIISGVEPMRASYAVSMFQPTRLVIHYERCDTEPWALSRAEVFGPIIKEDGSLARADGCGDIWRNHEDAPRWVQKLINQHMPTN